MPLGEIYIKLVVGFPNDQKVRALARFGAPDAGLARDLYVQMCLFCKSELSDGFVPAEQVGILVYPLDPEHGNQLAKQLASVGLTKEATKGEANGWDVLAFVPRNGTKEDVERLSQVRAEAGARGGRKSRKRPVQPRSQAKGKQVANQGGNQTGSNTVSVSGSVKTTDPETEIQTPTASAELTLTQRAQQITDAYYAVEPMCKYPAVLGVVTHALKTGKYTDEQVRDAVLRMANTGVTVTIAALRTEIEGFTPRDYRQESEQAKTSRAMQRAAAREGST